VAQNLGHLVSQFVAGVFHNSIDRINNNMTSDMPNICSSAPLIRFRPWRYINLFIYLLTYLLTSHNLIHHNSAGNKYNNQKIKYEQTKNSKSSTTPTGVTLIV